MQQHSTQSFPVDASPATKFSTGFNASGTSFLPNVVFHLIAAVFLGTLITVCCRPLSAQSGTNHSKADPATIQRAISQLGDVDPSIRQAAQEELRRIGSAAIEALEKAAKFETTLDYETQIAAVKILESIRDAMALEETNSFVRGETGITGWQEFQKFAGDTPESRSLYREIYLKNRSELTKALREDADYFVGFSRLKELFESPDLKQVCFGMFLLTRKQTQQNAAQNSGQIPALSEKLSEHQLVGLLSVAARSTSPLTKLRTEIEPVASLIRSFIETTPKEYSLSNRQLTLIRQINSPKIGPLLVELAAPEKPTVVRALAISHAIKIGDAQTFDQLQTYLNDNTVVGQFLIDDDTADEQPTKDEPANRLISEVRIRDIVLLGNLRLADKDHVVIGFNREAAVAAGNNIDIKKAGFKTDEARQKAFERYQASNQ